MVGFDTETTGVNPHDDDVRVVTCSLIRYDSGKVFEKNWMLDPGVEIPSGASDVHGITTEMAKAEGGDYFTGMQEIADMIAYTIKEGTPLVAYNGSFDATLLRVEFNRINVEFDDSLWDHMILVDPYVIDVSIDKYRRGGHKLGTVAKLYGYDLDNAHDASADVYATLAITRKIMPKFLEYIKETFGEEAKTYEDLMEIQPILYKKYKEGLEKFFRRENPNKTLNKSWPFADPEED